MDVQYGTYHWHTRPTDRAPAPHLAAEVTILAAGLAQAADDARYAAMLARLEESA